LPRSKRTTSSALDVKKVARADTAEGLITVGELSARTGVAVSALRYYEELGLLTPRVRVSGKRRYASDAVTVVGVIRFLRDVHFTLSEIAQLTAAEPGEGDVWRTLAERKLIELDDLIASAKAARDALDHGRQCPHKDARECATFWRIVARHQAGEPARSSTRKRSQPESSMTPPAVAAIRASAAPASTPAYAVDSSRSRADQTGFRCQPTYRTDVRAVPAR
jgi:DNA-binding transcriptional MerR regulator